LSIFTAFFPFFEIMIAILPSSFCWWVLNNQSSPPASFRP
jgi:hypothetical protein